MDSALENRPLPSFLIVGAQKSASTFLHRALASHPQVQMPTREIRFFEDPEYTASSPSDLSALFKADAGCTARGIKRPDYLARREVPERIKALLPNAKIIAVLRRPIDRLVSAYYHYVNVGFFPVVHINIGLREILDGDPSRYHRHKELLDYGLYGEHLARYLTYFDRTQLKVYLHDELVRDSERVLQDVARFLDIDGTRFPRLSRARNLGIYSIPRLRFYTQRNRFMLRYDAHWKIRVTPPTRPGYWIGLGISALDRLVLSRVLDNSPPRLDPELAARLESFYQDDQRLLESLKLVSLAPWARGQQGGVAAQPA